MGVFVHSNAKKRFDGEKTMNLAAKQSESSHDNIYHVKVRKFTQLDGGGDDDFLH
jgi:hypothetical protein